MAGGYLLFFLPLIIILALLIYLKYLAKQAPCLTEISLIILTDNCGEIVEGAIRELKSFYSLDPRCEIIIVDKFSEDDTWKIVSQLAKSYNYLLCQDGPDELTAYSTGKRMASGERVYLISINESSSYPKIKNKLDNIKRDMLKEDYYKIVM